MPARKEERVGREGLRPDRRWANSGIKEPPDSGAARPGACQRQRGGGGHARRHPGGLQMLGGCAVGRGRQGSGCGQITEAPEGEGQGAQNPLREKGGLWQRLPPPPPHAHTGEAHSGLWGRLRSLCLGGICCPHSLGTEASAGPSACGRHTWLEAWFWASLRFDR